MPHTTELPYTPHRAQHSPIEQLPGPVADIRGHYGTPYRSIDILERLQARGIITVEMCKAGQKFHDTFRRAAHDQLRSPDLGRIPGHNRKASIVDAVENARESLWRALLRLGGLNTTAGSCAWTVLGLEISLRSWAIEKSGIRPTEKGRINEHEARGVLRATLEILAAHYAAAPARKNNR